MKKGDCLLVVESWRQPGRYCVYINGVVQKMGRDGMTFSVAREDLLGAIAAFIEERQECPTCHRKGVI